MLAAGMLVKEHMAMAVNDGKILDILPEADADKYEAKETVKEKSSTEKPRGNRNAQTARRQLTICEKEIGAQEETIAQLQRQLEESGSDYEKYAALYEEKTRAEQALEALMEKWETLAEQAGE